MKKILKWIGIVFVVLIVIGIFSGASKPEDSKTEGSNKATQKQEQKVESPTQVTAQELADAFDENQIAAEDKWKGKLVEFSAEITNITDAGLSFSKVASKEFSMAQISCKVADKKELLSLKNGQTVTVRGVVGGQLIGVIDVSDCTVVQ